MKRHVVDARGFRETGYVYQRDEDLSTEEEKAHLAQSEKDVAELKRLEAFNTDAKRQARESFIDRLMEQEQAK